jgi:hypothetical protein
MAAWANQRGLSVYITGIDQNGRAIDHARRRHGETPNLSFVHDPDLNWLSSQAQRSDYALSTLVLHHVDDSDVESYLSLMDASVNRRFIVDDLVRSAFSYYGYTLLAGVLFRGSFAFSDGRLSILRSFTPRELEARLAPLNLDCDIRIITRFPGRLSVIGTRQI